jgi:hypothetical protein
VLYIGNPYERQKITVPNDGRTEHLAEHRVENEYEQLRRVKFVGLWGTCGMTDLEVVDIDGDGDLDVLVANDDKSRGCYPYSGCYPNDCSWQGNIMFINEGLLSAPPRGG